MVGHTRNTVEVITSYSDHYYHDPSRHERINPPSQFSYIMKRKLFSLYPHEDKLNNNVTEDMVNKFPPEKAPKDLDS